MRTSPLLLFVLASMAVDATAGGYVVAGGVAAGPWLAPYGVLPPAIVYDAFGRCLAPLNCPDYEQMRRFLERYERNYGSRSAPEKPALGVPVPVRDVPPTPAAHIQPAYRAASQIRPEFEHTGKQLDTRAGMAKDK